MMADMSRWSPPPPGVDSHEWESANHLVAQQRLEPLGDEQTRYLTELLANPACDGLSDDELVELAAAVPDEWHRKWRADH